MTFKEFTKAIKKDDRLMELLNRCDPSTPLTDEETEELVNRAEHACNPDLFEDDGWW